MVRAWWCLLCYLWEGVSNLNEFCGFLHADVELQSQSLCAFAERVTTCFPFSMNTNSIGGKLIQCLELNVAFLFPTMFLLPLHVTWELSEGHLALKGATMYFKLKL